LFGGTEVVRRLVRHGCDVDARSERNRTALHMAVWNNRARIVRFLLNSHCSLNVRDRYGDTPLMLSARRGYPEITEVCLQSLVFIAAYIAAEHVSSGRRSNASRTKPPTS